MAMAVTALCFLCHQYPLIAANPLHPRPLRWALHRKPPRSIVVRPETATELGGVKTIETVAGDDVHRALYLFPLANQD